MSRVQSLAEANYFSSSLCVQCISEAHPASYPMGTGVPFPGIKHGQGVMLTTHPHQVPRSRMSRNYTPSPPWSLNGGSRTALLYVPRKRPKLNLHTYHNSFLLTFFPNVHYQPVISHLMLYSIYS
jgi:hypothetical protein